MGNENHAGPGRLATAVLAMPDTEYLITCYPDGRVSLSMRSESTHPWSPPLWGELDRHEPPVDRADALVYTDDRGETMIVSTPPMFDDEGRTV